MVKQAAKRKVPTSLNPKDQKGFGLAENNQASHLLVTPTFWCAMNLLCFILMVCLGIGGFLLFDATILDQIEIDYGVYCKTQSDQSGNCLIEFTPQQNLIDPKVYYRLDNFYHAHRSFVKSRSWQQLRGQDVEEVKKCAPVSSVSDLIGWWQEE